MNEAFLHYIWQFQYFDQQNLRTTTNEPIQILKAGYLNRHEGADFQQAEVLIDGIRWVGSVEIHLNSADWHSHQHSQKATYNNVILHVVWQDNSTRKVARPDGTQIPTLILSNKISLLLLEKYQLFIDKPNGVIPCATQWNEVATLHQLSMLDYVLTQRLQKKGEKVLTLLQANRGDWEETTYQWLAQSFGFKVNNDGFLALAQSLPLKIVQKNHQDLLLLEALLLGQAGFLMTTTAPADEYIKKLQENYDYLKHKYNLSTISTAYWSFGKLRPANFPTLRLAQLAVLLSKQPHLFSFILHTQDLKVLQNVLSVEQSTYWQQHYDFGKKGTNISKNLGKESINNLIINTVAPLLVAYSQQQDTEEFTERAISFLEQLPPEHNHITTQWETIGLQNKTAFDSQASIELYNEYCTKKRCIMCRIGKELIK